MCNVTQGLRSKTQSSRLLRLIFLLSATLFISSCGGGDGDSETTQNNSDNESTGSLPKTVEIISDIQTAKILVNQDKKLFLDVKANIPLSQLKIKTLTALDSYTEKNCQVTTDDQGLDFQVSAESTSECRYHFNVVPTSRVYTGSTTNLLRVSASATSTEENLPLLSSVGDIHRDVILDLQGLLGTDWPAGYLLQENVHVFGNIAATASGDAAHTITVSTAEPGVVRVLYSLSNGTDTKLGTIDVAFSSGVNHPPVIHIPIYYATYQTNGEGVSSDVPIDFGEEIVIDLMNCNINGVISPCVDSFDQDGDPITISELNSYNSTVTKTGNLSFTFSSNRAGLQQVSYTITDGKGGYAVGLVSVLVEPDMSLANMLWGTIYTQLENAVPPGPNVGTIGIALSPPITTEVADRLNIAYKNSYIEPRINPGLFTIGVDFSTFTGGEVATNVSMALMTFGQAQKYCTLMGARLPTQYELRAGLNNNVLSELGYPDSQFFWTGSMSDANGNIFVLDSDGKIDVTTLFYDAVNPDNPLNDTAYATCLLDENTTDGTVDGVVGKLKVTDLEATHTAGTNNATVSGYLTDDDILNLGASLSNISSAEYRNITLSVDPYYGMFSNGKSSITVKSGDYSSCVNAECINGSAFSATYIDTALTSAVIKINYPDYLTSYVTYNVYDFINDSFTSMQVNNASQWQVQTTSASPLPIDLNQGLPVRYGVGNKYLYLSNLTYLPKESITARFKISKMDAIQDDGSISFFIEQGEPLANNLVMDPVYAFPQLSGNANNIYGLTLIYKSDTSTGEYVLGRAIRNGVIGQEEGVSMPEIYNGDLYVWVTISSKDATMTVYLSTSSIRPREPSGIVDITGFDPTSNLYFGFAGVNNLQIDDTAYISEGNIITFDKPL
ncbi:hypothetical protein KDD30_17545 (plasmid) [Photobacterium sp. GJ3]|uniref:Ig-like domain-containing protein n=1 Tax=Photobacterium sp. GJ3 TaxID=2829502 RepID=UPI001B8D862B|nr:hypothetical protein [Photobacterium sp. GJ3]QUJ69963.1 hypothetical protein KDD30_17545 [Photobacterium sp. GJ3]